MIDFGLGQLDEMVVCRLESISKTTINLFFRLFLPAKNACFLIQWLICFGDIAYTS